MKAEPEKVYVLWKGKHAWFLRTQAYPPTSDGRLLANVGKWDYVWFNPGNWSSEPLSSTSAVPIEDLYDD